MNPLIARAEAPPLLCLNLRCEHAGAMGKAAALTLTTISRTLARSRAEGRRVMHAHTVQPRDPTRPYGALPGLEPLVDEPVYALTGASAFSEPILADLARTGGVHMVGALYSRAGLASVLMAQELGLSLQLIAEACFSPGVEAIAPARVFDLVLENQSGVSLVGALPLDGATYGENVICLETRRT